MPILDYQSLMAPVLRLVVEQGPCSVRELPHERLPTREHQAASALDSLIYIEIETGGLHLPCELQLPAVRGIEFDPKDAVVVRGKLDASLIKGVRVHAGPLAKPRETKANALSDSPVRHSAEHAGRRPRPSHQHLALNSMSASPVRHRVQVKAGENSSFESRRRGVPAFAAPFASQLELPRPARRFIASPPVLDGACVKCRTCVCHTSTKADVLARE